MNENIITNSAKAWMLAARPKTLTGAIIPVMLAGSLAFHDGAFQSNDLVETTGAYSNATVGLRISLWVCCLLFACLMQVAANFINDLYDYLKGTDREDRLGPERACAQGWITPNAMKLGIAVVIILACAVGLTAVLLSYKYLPWSGWEFVLLGALCVMFAFLYTTRLSYLGWGDVLVLVFFGFVPVCGTYYLLMLTVTPLCVLVSLASGLAIDALLMINNYRDRNEDRISGKRTLVVRYGEKFGLYAYLVIGLIVTLLMIVIFIVMPKEAPNSLLSGFFFGFFWIYLSLHYRTWRRMERIHQGKALNKILGETSRNMLVMAIILSITLMLG